MNIRQIIQNMFFYIEAFILWCFVMVLGALSGYIPGWKGGYNIFRCIQRKNILDNIPYEKILSIAKKNELSPYCLDNEENDNCYITNEDIAFYAFMVNKKIRCGIRSFIICLLLCAMIVMGLDWAILYFLIGIVFLFGVLKLVQGSMDIL